MFTVLFGVIFILYATNNFHVVLCPSQQILATPLVVVNIRSLLTRRRALCTVEPTVAYADGSMCRRSAAVQLRQSRGFLSNLVADETGCGSFDSAWWLAAEPGQRLRLTLYDFAVAVEASSTDSGRRSSSSSSMTTGRHRHGSSSSGSRRMAVCR